jgi:hypothetical protein
VLKRTFVPRRNYEILRTTTILNKKELFKFHSSHSSMMKKYTGWSVIILTLIVILFGLNEGDNKTGTW